MNQQTKKWLKFTLRWGVAVVGITWVLVNTSFRDRVFVLGPPRGVPVAAQALNNAKEEDQQFLIVENGANGERLPARTVSRDELWTRPDRKTVMIRDDQGAPRPMTLRATKPGATAPGSRGVREILVQDRATGAVTHVLPSRVADRDPVTVSSPMVEIGISRMVREAQPWYLLGAILIFPFTYVITGLRWHLLLSALDIRISRARTFVLNMVGSFYNAFMPGTTGGDLIKAYYAAKHTPYRTRAVMSVIIDRAIGLVALVVLGGVMASLQYKISPDCRRVAKASGGLLALTALGLVVFYTPLLRRFSGLDFILKRLPMQTQVHKAVEAMDMYGRRPGVLLLAGLMSFPVHVTTITSATLAGWAFNLPLPSLYYWAVVPVIALVGAVPISPQGAGVMEVFAIALTRRHHTTVSQAFALTMSIRFIQLLWNLVAGVFVLRGGYHAPTESEQQSLESDAARLPAEPIESLVPATPAATPLATSN